MQRCLLHREIGIDVGHRVPDHGSKCRNPHGHRYRIIATCEGPVIDKPGNEEHGMVIDFGNVKKYMMDFLDSVFDHGFVVCKTDLVMMDMFFPGKNPDEVYHEFGSAWQAQIKTYISALFSDSVEGATWPTNPIFLPRTRKSEQDPSGMKVIVVPYVPTAENLAKHMFEMLRQPIAAHYGNDIKLVNLRLFETPNGAVDYPGMLYQQDF